MRNKTVIPFGDPSARVPLSAGLMAMNFQRLTTLNRLTGTLAPGITGVEKALRMQSDAYKPIVRAIDLGVGRGDEVRFDLVQPVKTKPIMGDRKAEGRGAPLGFTNDRLRVNQARFPVDLGGRMTQIRAPGDIRRLGKPVAQNLMDRYCDQSILVHAAGARGFQDNIEWVVPQANDPDFAEIMVNPVRPPSANRHFIVDGSNGIKAFAANAGEVAITSLDVLKMAAIDAISGWVGQVALPPAPVIFEGDEAATDSPLRVFLASPSQYAQFVTDPAFRTYQANAMARASQAKGHPLFRGEAGLWNGILIIRMPKPIRFYAGDPMEYIDANGDVQTALVPAALGANLAVDRGILLGGQALAEAFGSAEQTGIPFYWSEKLLDHDNAKEIAIGTIRGVSKIVYDVDMGAGGYETTDYGVAVVDSIVNVMGRT